MAERSVKLQVNGHCLNVEQAGEDSGPAVVLLHHGLGSTRAWRGQIPALAEGGFHVVAYDRWGYGGSDTRPALDLPGFTTDLDDLHALLQQLNIPKTALVGHSDGGTIALYFAARWPEMVSCLVTVAAHIYVEPRMEPGIWGIRQAFDGDERFRKGLRQAHGDKFQSVFENWFGGWYKPEFLSWDMRTVLKQIRCPTLVVQGEEDEHATSQHARDIAAWIPGSELWLVPGAQHMLPQENAAIFTPRLLQFLEQYATLGNGQG